MAKKIGVFICYCGGNISDFVDVEKIAQEIAHEDDVVRAKTHMFVCSDAAQEEIIREIKERGLEALVIASCSPKLHLETFRRLAQRAGLNPYTYIQVNIREQCSWAHTHNREEATEKALRLVRAGVARARMARPLKPIEIKTIPAALVVGAGITGLRTAVALSDLGLTVHLVEKEKKVGGLLNHLDRLFPYGRQATELIEELRREVERRENIHLYLEAEVTKKTGSVGDFKLTIVGPEGEKEVHVGAVLVATGGNPYVPKPGEYGYGAPGILTLLDFHRLIKDCRGAKRFVFNGHPVRRVVFIYCVGFREKKGHRFCSRYCCAAGVYAGLTLKKDFAQIEQFHLYRDMRTYGSLERLYHQALEEGLVFVGFNEAHRPEVLETEEGLTVRVKDELTGGKELTISCDLIVLVTGLEGKEQQKLVDVLKLPVGKDGFFNEIHPKLRPVETVIDGLFIMGACQAPKNISESVASGLAAAAKSGVLLLPGKLDLEPQIVRVNLQKCSWCGLCAEACPYEAIVKEEIQGKAVARVNPALCKGEGACVPVCPEEAIEVQGYEHQQIKAMIDALCKETS